MTDEIISRIEFLDREKADIKRAYADAPDAELKRYQAKRLVRNTKTVFALYELLSAKKYERTRLL